MNHHKHSTKAWETPVHEPQEGVMGGVSQGDIGLEKEVYYISPPQDCDHSPRPQSERVSPQMGEPASNGREKDSA